MATLHIEHQITDLDTWLGAFRRFAPARREAGVQAEAIHRPLDDERYIYVRLEFADAQRAEAFKDFLEANVWSSAEASPGLAGTPRARVLAAVDAGS
jgi:hypothetical protein